MMKSSLPFIKCKDKWLEYFCNSIENRLNDHFRWSLSTKHLRRNGKQWASQWGYHFFFRWVNKRLNVCCVHRMVFKYNFALKCEKNKVGITHGMLWQCRHTDILQWFQWYTWCINKAKVLAYIQTHHSFIIFV